MFVVGFIAVQEHINEEKQHCFTRGATQVPIL